MALTSAQKKRQDERHLKALRELALTPDNRYCFECGQRGPTYINITEGSFCCTQCSGVLRGLNPPHRVKSISMASFTPEEVERIRSLGNAHNARIWLGLYGGSPPPMTNKDEIHAFMIKKYEKRAWYVSPHELAEQERLMTKAKEVSSQGGSSDRSVASSNKPASLDLFTTDVFTKVPNAMDEASHQSAQQPTFSPPPFVAPPPPLPFSHTQHQQPPTHVQTQPEQPVTQKTNAPLDPFSPFTEQKSDSLFADFDSKFDQLTMKGSSTVAAFAPTSMQLQSVDAQDSQKSMPKSMTMGVAPSAAVTNGSTPMSAANPFLLPDQSFQSMPPTSADLSSSVMATPYQMQPVQAHPTTTTNIPAQPVQSHEPAEVTERSSNSASIGDKYSALAELDQLFHHSGTNQGSGDKQGWMPSGFSTGVPPAQRAPIYLESKPTFPESNGVGSSWMPKSSTVGAMKDVTGSMPNATGTQSIMNLAGNPFGMGAQQPMNAWGNMTPNVQMQIRPPVPPSQPFVSSNQPGSANYNPFL